MKKFMALFLACLTMMFVFTGCVRPDDDDVEVEPTPKVYYQNPFTGEEQSIDYPVGQRPVAVMVDNIMSGSASENAWPQSGLSKADIIFEMETEGGITRYMALFRDWTKMPVVGPIRSARDQLVQMMLPYSCLYVHDGGSTYAKAMLYDVYHYEDRDLTPNKGIAFRDYNAIPGTNTEHTEYTSGQLINEAIESGKYDLNVYEEPVNVFNWVKYDEPARVLDGIDVDTIEWRFSNSYGAKMTYDATTGKYTKDHINLNSGFSRTLVDAGENRTPVEFDNVFVLWTQVERYPDKILSNFSFSWGGVGYYFNGGKVEKVRWLKGLAHEPLKIVSLDGTETEVEINVGKSYVTFVSLDYFGAFAMNGELVDVAGDYKTPEEIPDIENEGQESLDE